MTRGGAATVLVCVGAIIGRLVQSGGFGWFVQQRMRIPLALAALIILAFGLYLLLVHPGDDTDHDGHDHDGHDHDGHDDHDHGRVPKVGWLMALPILVLISVAPTALGASAADRLEAITPLETTERFPPLSSDEPTEMGVYDFIERAVWDDERTLEGAEVRLVGLVVNDDEIDDGFRLTRFLVSCCAADGLPVQVVVHGLAEELPNDTWVDIVVTWRPPEVPYGESEGTDDIEADIVELQILDEPPADPYESPY
ncbi:MAG: TIGR03943 family putative permease subunit [Acidimicrobiales bacterium]